MCQKFYKQFVFTSWNPNGKKLFLPDPCLRLFPKLPEPINSNDKNNNNAILINQNFCVKP